MGGFGGLITRPFCPQNREHYTPRIQELMAQEGDTLPAGFAPKTLTVYEPRC